MTIDVGTTPRKPLTPTQRLALWERFKGVCVVCKQKIDGTKGFIDEHMTALGLGGTNDPKNRGIAHKGCAGLKTYGPDGDLARIAKAKRKKRKHLGIVAPGPKIQSAGFHPADKNPNRNRPTKQIPKPRGMFA